jgi:hypothetical protein
MGMYRTYNTRDTRGCSTVSLRSSGADAGDLLDEADSEETRAGSRLGALAEIANLDKAWRIWESGERPRDA